MSKSASYDVGCGTYAYQITAPQKDEQEPAPPKTPLELQERFCFATDAFGDHGDVQGSFHSRYIGFACAGTAKMTIRKDDKESYINFSTRTNGVPYTYNIYWKDGCETDVTEVNAWTPLEGNEDATCESLLQDDYKQCKSDTTFERRG